MEGKERMREGGSVQGMGPEGRRDGEREGGKEDGNPSEAG